MGSKYIEIYDLVQASPDEYLMHHQIKGAKWGVHRGPPYPLQNGIRTKIKKITIVKAAEDRIRENRAKRAAKTAAKKEAKSEAKAKKKGTLQDQIDKMSDAELIERTNRLRLENAYKRELPHEEKGKNFLQKSAEVFNNLGTAGEAFGRLVKTGKDLAKIFGLSEDETANDLDWSKRKPGETAKQYSDRLNALKNIRSKKKEFEAEDRKASQAAAEKRAKEKAAAEERSKARTQAWKDAAYNANQARKDRAKQRKASKPSSETGLITQSQADQERWEEFKRRTGFR